MTVRSLTVCTVGLLCIRCIMLCVSYCLDMYDVSLAWTPVERELCSECDVGGRSPVGCVVSDAVCCICAVVGNRVALLFSLYCTVYQTYHIIHAHRRQQHHKRGSREGFVAGSFCWCCHTCASPKRWPVVGCCISLGSVNQHETYHSIVHTTVECTTNTVVLSLSSPRLLLLPAGVHPFLSNSPAVSSLFASVCGASLRPPTNYVVVASPASGRVPCSSPLDSCSDVCGRMQKAVKSRVLSLLSTRWGVLLASIGAIWCVLSTAGLLLALVRSGQRSAHRTSRLVGWWSRVWLRL